MEAAAIQTHDLRMEQAARKNAEDAARGALGSAKRRAPGAAVPSMTERLLGNGMWHKLAHMDRRVLIRKLLSFDDAYVTAVRPFRPGTSLPGHPEGAFAPIALSRAYWYADPALFAWGGKTWLFVEAFERRTHLGRIACLCLEEGNEPRVVLREPFHLSFPQVFAWRGGIWMLPETGGDHSLRLYRAVDFPWKWELARRFPTGVDLVDTVVVGKSEDCLELLTSELSRERQYFYRYHRMTLTPGEGGALEDDPAFLAGQSFSHRARNAGGLFREGGELILPTQESTSTEYGVRLSFVRYREGKGNVLEDPVGGVSPEDVTVHGFDRGGAPRVFGVHSYARTERYEVIDIQHMEFEPMKYPRKLLGRFRPRT